ncbi:MAG TPA: GAF domain-containing protein [Candidatus Limnocylindrales bacterium]|nr:GAF domain-containing protein [Candidatus Limnocylindrales bacterium]
MEVTAEVASGGVDGGPHPPLGPGPLPVDLRAILQGIAAGVTVQDEGGRLLFANDDAARLSGFGSSAEMLAATPDELVERLELTHEDGRPFDRSLLPGRRVLAGEPVDPVIIGFSPVAGGDIRWSMLLARAATLGDGRRVAINTFHDVTSRIETERRIRASERSTQEIAEGRRRAEEIARMLADAALRLDEAADLEAIIQVAAMVAIPVVADWCVVDLVLADGTVRRAALAARDERLRELVERLRDQPSVGSPVRGSGRALASGSAVVALDIEAWWATETPPDPELREMLEATGIRSAIAQPLIARGDVIGSIVYATVDDRSFDQPAVAATLEIANRIALAIANGRSHEAEQLARRAAEELADRMERLQTVTRTLADATTIADVAAVVADEARQALGAESVVVGLLDETATRLDLVVRESGRPPDENDGQPPGGAARSLSLDADVPLATAVRKVRPVWVDGRSKDGVEASGCAVPLVGDHAPLGGLWLGFREPRTFAPADQRLVRAYADLAAGAIVRLRLGSVRQLLLSANEAERARLESVLRRMPIGVILAAVPDGRFLYANEAAQRLSPLPVELGETPAYEAARGFRPDGSELGPEDWPLRRAMRGETVENEVIEIAYDGGSRRTYGLSAAPIPGPTGAIETAVVTYADVTDRIQAQQRETFLARASEVLASSLDYEATVQAVADLAVPDFADWCVVQLASEDGLPRRIAVAHRDPDLVALAVRLQEEYPADPDATSGVAEILRTGKSEYVAEIPDEVLDAAARDERHLEMIRALALRSYISVPLIAAGRTLGVLTLVASDSGRRFEPDDVAFAENLAVRAAGAIENARLFREGVRFKRLLDATGDAILMLDPAAGRIAYANRGAAEQLERSVDDLVGSPIGEHLDATGTAALIEAMSDLTGGTTDARTVTLQLHRPSGSIRPVEVRLEYVAPDGAPARILAIARDIRDRIQAQERLRGLAAAEHARAAELNAVIRAMGDGVVVCDRAGRIILANPAAENVFPDVDETTYVEILAQLDDPDGLAPELGGRGGPVELRVRSEDERWIEVSTWPVAAGPDRLVGHEDETIVLLRDVTVQRQQQAVRDTFIGVLSHELRTPVTTIYAGAKVLARPGTMPDATRQEIFHDIVIESERLHRLVEDVVAMTRFGDEGGDVGAEPVLLQRLLPAVVASEDGRWPGVSFEAVVPPGLPTVIADPTYVEQVVRNLLSNAAKYGGPGASVRALVEAADGEVLVRILDDGPGFPPDERERLFDLFFRSAQTARAAAGAGIGLFVCARLIKAMGGRIWATNRSEGGAEFGFALRVMGEDD